MMYFDFRKMIPNISGKTGRAYFDNSSKVLAGRWLIGCRKIKVYKVMNEAWATIVENTEFQSDQKRFL